MASPEDPQTAEQWQEAVDHADFWLQIHSAVVYGVVKYNGQINVGRCEELLRRGAALGYRPRPVEEITREIVVEAR